MNALRKLGANLRRARLLRSMSLDDLAARSEVSERTLRRLEQGDPGIGIGALANVLAALGDTITLGEIMSYEKDPIGQAKSLEQLPKRGRTAGRRPGRRPAGSAPDAAPDDTDPDGVAF